MAIIGGYDSSLRDMRRELEDANNVGLMQKAMQAHNAALVGDGKLDSSEKALLAEYWNDKGVRASAAEKTVFTDWASRLGISLTRPEAAFEDVPLGKFRFTAEMRVDGQPRGKVDYELELKLEQGKLCASLLFVAPNFLGLGTSGRFFEFRPSRDGKQLYSPDELRHSHHTGDLRLNRVGSGWQIERFLRLIDPAGRDARVELRGTLDPTRLA
jgi:hypothetical protein